MAKKKRFYTVTLTFIGVYAALLLTLMICAIGAGIGLPQFQWYNDIVQEIHSRLGIELPRDKTGTNVLVVFDAIGVPAMLTLLITASIEDNRKRKWYLSNERDSVTEISVKRPRQSKKGSYKFTIKWGEEYKIQTALSPNDADWDWIVNHPRLQDRENVLGLRNRAVSNNWEDKVKGDKFEKSSGESRAKSVPRSGSSKKEDDSGKVFWILFVILIFVLIAVFGVPILRLEIWVKPLTP